MLAGRTSQCVQFAKWAAVSAASKRGTMASAAARRAAAAAVATAPAEVPAEASAAATRSATHEASGWPRGRRTITGHGEAAVRAAFPGAAIIRPSIVFGREDQFINRFAGMVAKAPVVPVLRAPVKFQPVFAADVGDAMANATGAAYAGRTFELGGPDVMTMGEIIRWIAATLGRSPSIVELPDAAGALLAALPLAPITKDQWLMLQHDNVVAAGAEGLAALGVDPTPLQAVAPDWLVRFRRTGRFGRRAATLAA
jgi:NADH dehydrogenase